MKMVHFQFGIYKEPKQRIGKSLQLIECNLGNQLLAELFPVLLRSMWPVQPT